MFVHSSKMVFSKFILPKQNNYCFPIIATFPDNYETHFSTGSGRRTKVQETEVPSDPHINELVTVDIPGSTKSLDLHPTWLRHHCQCEKCFNHTTHQRISIPSELLAKSVVIDIRHKAKTVELLWNDHHVSSFDLNWLQYNIPKKSTRTNLNPNFQHTVPKFPYFPKTPDDPLENAVSYNEFMKPNTDEGVGMLLENILAHGYGIIKEAPPDFESTKKAVLRISHPQNTIYGNFSQWTSNLAHADTAYTSDFVHLHTDTSYFSEPMGLQMFHCLNHTGSGGINAIVDGFKIASKLWDEFPDLYKALQETIIPAQYLDPGKHYFYSLDVTLKPNVFTGLIERVRYNPHDMAIINTISSEQVGPFYDSLIKFSNEIEKNPTWLKLAPGIIIFLDNWRVLHGRSEFTGFRSLCGAYIGRSDWLSKARTLGIINAQ